MKSYELTGTEATEIPQPSTLGDKLLVILGCATIAAGVIALVYTFQPIK